MLDLRKQNGIGTQLNKSGRTGGVRASAVLLAAVTALSPISAQGAMAVQKGFWPVSAAAAASVDSTAGTTEAAAAASADSTADPAAATADSTAGTTEAATASADSTADPAAATADSASESTAVPASDSAADTAAVSSGREIFVHLADAPEDPVPAKVMDTDTASLLKLVSEGLVVLDENNDPAPGCAESWDVSEDGLKWTFHLREDLKWSDGFSMNASDFVSLFKNIADTSTEALYGPELTQNIAGYEDVLNGDVDALGVSAPDAHTFEVNLLTPDPDFARACASWSLLPLREQIREDFDDGISSDWNFTTGNGAYYIDSVALGKEFVLKKNPYYRQDEKEDAGQAAGKDESTDETTDGSSLETDTDSSPDLSAEAFDTVHWIVDGDINEDYSDFLNGDIDAISAIPEEEERILEDENLIRRKNLPDTMGICFNCRHQVLSDARVRRALSMAVDRTFIASTILQDVYQPEGGDGLSENGDVQDHIPEAESLLEEAGYKDGEGIPELTCIAEESGGALLTAEYLASAWRDLGIDVRIESVKAEDLAQEKKAGTFDIFCGSIFLASDLPAAELANFTTDNENNISGFSSQEYDLLLAQASEMQDEDEYAEALQQAFDMLKEEMPASPLATKCISWVSREEYPGISCDGTGCWQLQDIDPASAAGSAGNGISVGTAGSSAIGTGGVNTIGTDDAAGADASGTQSGKTGKEVSVTAQMPEGRSAAVQNSESAALPQIGVNGPVRQANRSAEADTSLDFIRSSDIYFERTSQTAYLTRQAWVYDGSGEDAKRTLSLPKYSEVQLTGIGNPRFVRITRDGKNGYLDVNKVTVKPEVIEGLRAQEKEGLAEKAVLTASLHTVKENELEDRAADARARTDEIKEAIARREMLRKQTRNPNWNGPVLSRGRGSVTGPSGKETYYNLNMNGVISIMRRMGNTDEYWVRDDGCKMLGDYIMCAANLRVHPRGSLVECSLGTCIVCDTGGFASRNSHQLDIAVTW